MPRGSRESLGLPRRLARWLVSGYPEPWRRRYQAEVLALLDDSGVRWRDATDLANGLVVERVRALIEPGRRPAVTLALIGIGMWLGSLALGLAAYGVGQAVRVLVEPPSTRWAALGLLMIGSALLGTSIHYVVWMQRNFTAYAAGEQPVVPRAALRMGVTLAGVAVISWAHPQGARGALLVWPVFMIALVGPPPRWQRARAAVLQIAAARHQMKWARLELERCMRLDADGMAAPLADAQQALEHIHRSREEAVATLNAMGYRAAFEPHDRRAGGPSR